MQQNDFTTTHLQLLPRVIRAKDAPAYLGMSRDVFNQTVRPYLIETPIGQQGIGFDRLDLDDWWVHYKRGNGRSAKSHLGETLWVNDNPCQDSDFDTESGTLINATSTSQEAAFNKALALAKKTSKKPKPV